MPASAEELVELLDLETIDLNLFRGQQPDTQMQRVFGGQVAAQALVAAVADRRRTACRCTRCTATSCGPATPPCRSCTTSTGSATAVPSRPAGCWPASTAGRSTRLTASFQVAGGGVRAPGPDAGGAVPRGVVRRRRAHGGSDSERREEWAARVVGPRPAARAATRCPAARSPAASRPSRVRYWIRVRRAAARRRRWCTGPRSPTSAT